MDIPRRTTRKYTDEEKRQLIANLDIEVAHRTRQFEAWLMDRLENFTLHQEGQVSRIPKQVRSMTMREFGEKYQGNVQSALRGFQKERLAAAGADVNFGEIDKAMRKRKFEVNQSQDSNAAGPSQQVHDDSTRATKTARTIPPSSPRKVAGPSTGLTPRPRIPSSQRTPGAKRLMGKTAPSPSPQKSRPPFSTSSQYNTRPSSTRPASPAKHPSTKPFITQSRVPSASSFNPTLPPKTPSYPSKKPGETQTARLPRRDESMLSVNGSPLANPYEFGLGWFKGVEMGEMEDDDDETDKSQPGQPSTLKRQKSSIIVRRDPSVALSSGLHTRTNSQASFYTASSSVTSSTHSRDNSQANGAPSALPAHHQFAPGFRFPQQDEATPRPISKHTRSFSALVAIPTKDGHVIEFDPLQTSPEALDALEGITDSAKKHARMEMGRLVQATMEKWKIG